MLRGIIDRPVSVAIATLTLVAIGFFSLLRLPVSLLPTLERPRLQVAVQDRDRSREQLVQQVVAPLERRFLSLPGVLDVRSTVDDGAALLRLETEWQTDVDRLRIDAERRLAGTPVEGLDELLVSIDSGDREPILEIAVLGGRSGHDRTLFADKVLIPELGRLDGAGRLVRLGGRSRRPVVRPDAAALAAVGLTAHDLWDRLRRVGSGRPLGLLRDGGRIRPALVREEARSIADLRQVRIPTAGGEAAGATGPPGVALGDLAGVEVEEVSDGSSFRLNGEPGVVVELHRAPGANAVLLAREARRELAALGARTRHGLRLEVARDASLEVWEALRQLALAGLLGLLLGALVLRFVLGSFGPTLALVVVVPSSIVVAFGGFYFWGVSLDVVSLAGLALAAGMLVDNAIVVLESIASARDREGSDDPVVDGTGQIAMALVASFLTTAVVFLPLVYLQGLARAFFGVQAFAIVTTLVISLALSLTLTPVLARRMARTSGRAGARGRSPGLGAYLAFLDRALERPSWVVLLTLAVLGAGLAAGLGLHRELLPSGPSRALRFELQLPAGTAIESAEAAITRLERAVATSGVEPTRMLSIYRSQEAEELEVGEMGDRGVLELELADSEELERALPALREALEGRPGIVGRLRPRRSAIAAAVDRGSGGLELEASASTPPRAEGLAERVATSLREDPGVRVRVGGDTWRSPRPAQVLEWNLPRLARLGLGPEELAVQVGSALGGRKAGRLAATGLEPEILLEATRPLDLSLVPVRSGQISEVGGTSSEVGGTSSSEVGGTSSSEVGGTSSEVGGTSEGAGRVVPLAALARFEQRLLPPPLVRRNGRPAVELEVEGSWSPGALEARIDGLRQSADEGLRLTGQAWEMRRSFGQLRLALGLALVLVFLTVAALYESLSVPLVVMVTVPVAAAGAFLALAGFGQSLNVMSFLGLVLLAGIVVNNAIVLIHRIVQLSDPAQDPREAIRRAAGERYRPILMTTITTLLGLVPLAMLGGEGIELRRALAVAVSGGLLASLLAALLVVPVLARFVVGRRG